MAKVHDFNEKLKASHEAEDLPFWEECYRQFFPDFQSMCNHRSDGWHQRAGIDRSVTLTHSKQILIDEKVRYKDHGDILLEYMSDAKRGTPGWVNKPLACDYIAYAVIPTGVCYLLPVIQLRKSWDGHGEDWIKKYTKISCDSTINGNRSWTTLSVAIPVDVLFKAIENALTANFKTFNPGNYPSTNTR